MQETVHPHAGGAAPAAASRPAHTAQDASRREAAAALQRALDRRDNGGATGH